MPRNIFAGGGVNAFQGENSPLYVQNMNSLKAAFTDLQNGVIATAPIGSVTMWSGTTANIPAGYAVANGAYLNTVTYATLYGIIGTRYGTLVGATFRLPDLTSRLPQGTVGVPTVPTTKITSASSAVDVHTHTVNSSFTAGNAATHTHAGGVLTAGSVNSSFTAGNSVDHYHAQNITLVAVGDHQHGYFKPNSGANNSTVAAGGHTHTFNGGVLQADRILSVNSSFTAGNTNTSITAPGSPNTTIAVNSSFTAGNATTINASTLAHTHNFAVTELVFIIRVI